MPDPQRVEFVTRHFKDLQSIRFAPVPALMLLAPLVTELDTSHVSKATAWGVLSGLLVFLLFVVGFFWWSTVAIKRRYGSVKESRHATEQMQGHPVLVAVTLIAIAALLWFKFVDPSHSHFSDVYTVFAILTLMLPRILDSTNPAVRRVVWAIALVALFGAGPFLIVNDVDGRAPIVFLGGIVWLSISIFDFLLLRRTFAEISASPSSAATDVVAQYG
jgi:hypothetical protein